MNELDTFIDDDEDGDMVSLDKQDTGIDHTIFVSTKGYVSERHGPRIKIAIDPKNRFVAGGKDTSMSMHDYAIRGEYISPALVEQAKRWIELNREVLIDYWDGRIPTRDLLARIRPIA